MSDQNPTPEPEHRDDRPEGVEPAAPGQPSDATYAPPQYGQPDHGQPQYGQPQADYTPPSYGQPDPSAQHYQAPQYGQQGYPQQPYGQQAYGQQAYGQQPADPQQYPAPPYPTQQYQQYPPAGYPSQWPTEQAQPQSNTLGMVGLGLVALGALVLAVVAYLVGGQAGQFMLDYGVDAMQNPDPNDPLVIALAQRVQGLSTVGMLATLGGIAGWVVSIIATSRRRGRTFGIWGIVLGIAAPIIAFIAMVMGMWPAMQVLAG